MCDLPSQSSFHAPALTLHLHRPLQHWITFQLLHAVAQCHERSVCHGDIKTENVLVTSWNWVFLTDFASYKPVRVPADHMVSLFLVCLQCGS